MQAWERAPRGLVPIVLLLFAFGPWAQAQAQEPTSSSEPSLRLEVVDAGSERRIHEVRCGLVSAVSGEVYARFEGEEYRGAARPREGDLLVVYRRGYDLARLRIPDDLSRAVRVELAPASRECVLRVEGAGAASLLARGGLRIQFVVRAEGLGRQGPIRDDFELRPREASSKLRWSAGTQLSPLATAEGCLVWPLQFVPRHGVELTLRIRQGRRVELLLPPGANVRVPGRLECLPDLLWAPAVDARPADARLVDAWRWHLNGPGWLESQILSGARRLRVLPDVPFHLLVVLDRGAVYRYVEQGAGRIDLESPVGPRTLAGRPRIDGRPAPGGTWLAPGRLDLVALTSLADRHLSMPGCCFVTPPLEAAWPAPELPAADWITAWHPRDGLAHLRWDARRIPEGERYKGVLIVVTPEGWEAEGYIAAYPIWKGTGAVRTTPPDRLLRRSMEGRRRVRIAGLAPGWYGLDLRLRVKQQITGFVRELKTMREFLLTAEEPVHRYELLK